MTEAPAAKPRRQRSATESLLSIALLLEAILVFFITLVVFGLRILPAGVAFGAGGVLFVLLLLDGRMVRRPAGVWLGWVLQAVLIAIGVIVPLMYFIGALFLAIWIFCFVTGRRLDRNNADYLSSTTEPPTEE